ncbi:hypothetical protein Lal_00040292 [Lupinus albus]|nr:hypothetical protein Lal_00040292 [Lupinus albus]
MNLIAISISPIFFKPACVRTSSGYGTRTYPFVTVFGYTIRICRAFTVYRLHRYQIVAINDTEFNCANRLLPKLPCCGTVNHRDGTFRSSTRLSIAVRGILSTPIVTDAFGCRFSKVNTRFSHTGSAATKIKSSFHETTPFLSLFHASANDSSACVPTHVASIKSPNWAPPSSNLYHCGARGLSGGSLTGISFTSKQTPPSKLRPSSWFINCGSHTETSRMEEESGASRMKAKVWFHSNNVAFMFFLAGFDVTWRLETVIFTIGFTSNEVRSIEEPSDVKLAVDPTRLIRCGPFIPLNLISEFDLDTDAAITSKLTSEASGGEGGLSFSFSGATSPSETVSAAGGGGGGGGFVSDSTGLASSVFGGGGGSGEGGFGNGSSSSR